MGLIFRGARGVGEDGGLVLAAEFDERRPSCPRLAGVGVSGGLGGRSARVLRFGVPGESLRSSSEVEAAGILMGDDLVDR